MPPKRALESSTALAANLEQAEEAMQKAQVVKPDPKELEAIKKFCTEEVKQRSKTADMAAELKTLRARQKALKDDLLKALQAIERGPKAVALSKADAQRLEALASSEGLPGVPPYLRLNTTNKDGTITPEVIQEALESITPEDLEEAAVALKADGTPDDKLKSAAVRKVALDNIRRLIRSYTESPKLLANLPRGLNVYDLAEAPSELADKMWSSWSTEQAIKRALAAKKQDPAAVKAQGDLKTKIEAFFVRTGLTAQRLVVEGQPYRLVRRVSVRKPKLGIGKLETILDEVLTDALGPSGVFRPTELIRALQIQVTSLPPETKSTVALCAVRAPKDDEQSSS